MTEQLERRPRADDSARQLYRYWLGREDDEHFNEVFLGEYASRAAFGEHLLEETYAATERVNRLPRELRPYVRFDTEQVVADWERAGHFIVINDPAGAQDEQAGTQSVLVFDAHAIGSLDRI